MGCLNFLVGVAGVLMATRSVLAYWSLEKNAFDLGLFRNAVYQISTNASYTSAVKGQINLYLDHQSPILLLFAAIYKFFPFAETLLIAQALLIASGGLAVASIALHYLPQQKRIATLFTLAYLSHGLVRSINTFDFHPEVVILPFALWAIACFLSRRWILAWILIALTLAGKETASFVVFGIGSAFLLGADPTLTKRQRTHTGYTLMALALTTFFFNALAVPFLLGAQKHAYTHLYSHLGNSYLEVALSPFIRPTAFWGMFTDSYRHKYVLALFGPFTFLCLFAPRLWILLLSVCAPLFLTNGDLRFQPVFHYAIEPMVAVVWASLYVYQTITTSHWKFKKFLKVVVITSMVIPIAQQTFRSDIFHIKSSLEKHASLNFVQDEIMRCLNPHLGVAASNHLVPHLAHRDWIVDARGLSRLNENRHSCVVILKNSESDFANDMKTIKEYRKQSPVTTVSETSDYLVLQQSRSVHSCWRCPSD